MRTLTPILFLLIFFAAGAEAYAQPHNRRAHKKIDKSIARKVMKRTAVVIMAAHKKVKEGKNYTGHLSRSIAHQKFAKHLYRKGHYHRAVYHSRYARLLAIKAIRENKGVEPPEAKFTPEEEELMKNTPSDAELDKALEKEMPAEKKKDEDALDSMPDIDLTDE